MELPRGVRFRDLTCKRLRNRTNPRSNYSTAGTQVSVDVDREEGLLGLRLRVNASMACGAGPGFITSAIPRSPCGLLQNLRVLANGVSEREMPADVHQFLGQWRNGRELLETVAWPAAGAGTTIAAVQTIDVWFSNRNLRDGEDHLGLIAAPTTRISVQWTWGVLTDLFVVPGGSTCTLDTANCFVEVELLRARVPGIRAQGYGAYVARAKQIAIPATTTAQPADLDGDAVYDTLIYAAREAGVPAAAPFTAGGQFLIERAGERLVDQTLEQALSAQRQRLPAGYVDTGILVVDPVSQRAQDSNTMLSAFRCEPNQALQGFLGVTAGAATTLLVVGEKYLSPDRAFALRGVANAANN